MTQFDYDSIVIGAGGAALSVAITAAEAGCTVLGQGGASVALFGRTVAALEETARQITSMVGVPFAYPQ